MAESTQKEMLQKLVLDVGYIMKKQDIMELKQDKMQLAQNSLKVELVGTEMDPDRGFVPRLIKVEKSVEVIKKKQYKIFTWGIVIIGVLNLLFLGIKSLFMFFKKGG